MDNTAIRPLTVSLFWNAREDLDVSFLCAEDGELIGHQSRDAPNVCGASLDVDEDQDRYNAQRGDGSLGQIENISVDTPTDGSTYEGSIEHYTKGVPVEFILVFSGLNSEDEAVIFDYIDGTLDPGVDRGRYRWSFTYRN